MRTTWTFKRAVILDFYRRRRLIGFPIIQSHVVQGARTNLRPLPGDSVTTAVIAFPQPAHPLCHAMTYDD